MPEFYCVATRTVRDNWAAYLDNRKFVEPSPIEDVIGECVEVADSSRLPKALTGGAKAFEHCNVKSHFFIVKESGDERVFIGMMPFSNSRPTSVSEKVPVVTVFPENDSEKIAVYSDWLVRLDGWLTSNRDGDSADRAKAVAIKNRCLKDLRALRSEIDPRKRFLNGSGKIQYEQAIEFLLDKVAELQSKVSNLELKQAA